MDINVKPSHRKSYRREVPPMDVLDYKNVELLSRYITDRGKILPGRTTGLPRRFQKKLENAIKRARKMALLPFAIHNFKVDFSVFREVHQPHGRHYDDRGGGRYHRPGDYGAPRRPSRELPQENPPESAPRGGSEDAPTKPVDVEKNIEISESKKEE